MNKRDRLIFKSGLFAGIAALGLIIGAVLFSAETIAISFLILFACLYYAYRADLE